MDNEKSFSQCEKEYLEEDDEEIIDCTMDTDCECEDCKKENIKMD